MGLFAATGGSSLAVAGSIVGSEKGAVWLSLVAEGGSGSALVYDDPSGSVAGRQIARLLAADGVQSPQIGPIISTCGLYLGNFDNASVNALVRPSAG